MKKMTEEAVRQKIQDYFDSRKTEKRDQEGQVILGKGGEVLYEEKPCTVTGLALALGFSDRESLFSLENKKIKALVDRALLSIEENAEEKLFSKDTFHGAKLFLETNFRRWRGEGEEPEGDTGLGVCTLWAE